MKSLLLALWLSAPAIAQNPVDPSQAITEAGEGTWQLIWPGISGHTYFLMHSDDFTHWFYCPVVVEGEGEEIKFGFWSDASSFFLRIQYTNQPSDSDILTSRETG